MSPRVLNHPPVAHVHCSTSIMTDQQCGLCLSCGAPFLPNIDEVDFFNREANLSVLFLNTQFKRNADIVRTYEVPKLCSQRQASHVIHVAYHQTALEYMCNRHTLDNDVGMPPAFAIMPNYVVPSAPNAPFLYYHTATGNKGPKAATWARPVRNVRLDMTLLLGSMIDVDVNDALAVPLQLEQAYDICAGCNALMTQKSHMRYLLGCRNAGAKNTRGALVPRDVFLQYNMESRRHALEDGYNHWMVQNVLGRRAPRRNKADSDAPIIAYYLHMCLPFQTGGTPNFFQQAEFRHPVRAHARSLYLELCWVVLEIACLATLTEEGTVTKPRGSKKSHGQHQHLGVLDLYVSYFLWRLMIYSYGNRGYMDFVHFHQKYFCDARNCSGLLSARDRAVTTGRLMYNTSNLPARRLVEQICYNLMGYFLNELKPLFQLCTGGLDPPPEVKEYFLPPQVVRRLQTMSTEVSLLSVRATLSL